MYLGELLIRQARYRPDHIGVVYKDHRLSYATFNRDVNRLANALYSKGFRKGDRIATVLPNCLELLTLYWAVAKIGIVVVPVSPLLLEKGLLSLFANANPNGVLASPAHCEGVRSINNRLGTAGDGRFYSVGERVNGFASYEDLIDGASTIEPDNAALTGDDLYNIVYSSGTTGEPKGITHNHYIRCMYAVLFASAWRMTPESIVLHSGALIFNGTFVTMLPSFFCGATFIFHETFDACEVIETIAREKVTHIMLVPSQIIAILNAPNFSAGKLASLEMLLSLGAPLHLEHKNRIAQELPGCFHELYGVTEGFITILDKTDFPRKPRSVGVPMQFNEIRIVDEKGQTVETGEIGEIIGRGPLTMPGYYDRPDLTAETIKDGWIYSGDLGTVDEDGFLYLVDRKKDMIISGGVNVYPRDIEEVIVRHAAVEAAAVFGIAHEKWGETLVAALVISDDSALSADEMKKWINDHVGAKYQRVHDVLLLDEFPKNAAGKILKRALRETYNEKILPTPQPEESSD